MGTRSVVARYSLDGRWEGRYVHWDGYPSAMIPALEEIIARDGFAAAERVLIDEHFGWSTINPGMTLDQQTEFHIVPLQGYGRYYNDQDGETFITDWADVKDCGAEYFYIMTPWEIECYDVQGLGPAKDGPIDKRIIREVTA